MQHWISSARCNWGAFTKTGWFCVTQNIAFQKLIQTKNQEKSVWRLPSFYPWFCFFFAGSAKAFGNRSHLMLITCTWRLDPHPAAHGDNSSHWQKKRSLKETSICLSVLLGYLKRTLSIYIYTYYLYVHGIYIYIIYIYIYLYSEMVEFWFWNMSGHSSWNLSTTSGKAHRNRHRHLHHKHYEHWKRALAACTDTPGGCKSSWCGKQCSTAAMEHEVKGVQQP